MKKSYYIKKNPLRITSFLTVAHRPGVVGEADSEGMQEARDMLPHRV